MLNYTHTDIGMTIDQAASAMTDMSKIMRSFSISVAQLSKSIDEMRQSMSQHPIRECPECSVKYYDIHPSTDCYHGITERIMEL